MVCLVTCVHSLTGYAPRRKLQPIGDGIEIELHLSDQDSAAIVSRKLRIFDDDGKPLYLTSTATPDADVAVLPLPSGLAQFRSPPKCFDMTSPDIFVVPFPGQRVSVIGYPFGWGDELNHLPIWKTGHIASEPTRDFNGDPRFLVDLTGRPGMSGSPVVVGRRELLPSFGGQLNASVNGSLLGVYASVASYQSGDPQEAEAVSIEEALEAGDSRRRPMELGGVWKASIIAQILASVDPRTVPTANPIDGPGPAATRGGPAEDEPYTPPGEPGPVADLRHGW
jgi:hypothetical protein